MTHHNLLRMALMGAVSTLLSSAHAAQPGDPKAEPKGVFYVPYVTAKPGTECVLRDASPNSTVVFIASNYFDFLQMNKSFVAKDTVGVKKLIEAGRASATPDLTKVIVLQHHNGIGQTPATTEVRLKSGDNKDKSVFVYPSSLALAAEMQCSAGESSVIAGFFERTEGAYAADSIESYNKLFHDFERDVEATEELRRAKRVAMLPPGTKVVPKRLYLSKAECLAAKLESTCVEVEVKSGQLKGKTAYVRPWDVVAADSIPKGSKKSR